jgi:hypothetical protein
VREVGAAYRLPDIFESRQEIAVEFFVIVGPSLITKLLIDREWIIEI